MKKIVEVKNGKWDCPNCGREYVERYGCENGDSLECIWCTVWCKDGEFEAMVKY